MLTVTLALVMSLIHVTLAGTVTNCTTPETDTKSINKCNVFTVSNCTPCSTLTLGNSFGKCNKECSNTSLAYIILFALMGAVGITLLALLGMTVATGTFNALIFYVNIVQANYDTFFKGEPLHWLLTVFLSWLNLEWGIETCLSKNMNAVTKVGLCYVFPVYFCLLASAFVRIANMKKLRKYCKKLSTSVLATAILLSYSPILKTFIESTLKGNDGDDWLYQCKARYLGKEHKVLFVVGLVIIIFFLIPFTLLLIFGPLLQPLAHNKPLKWIHRPCISALFTNFHSPLHKNKLWPGILLLARVLLFTTALVAKSGKISKDTNLNIIIMTVVCLAFTAWITEMPYKGVLLNIVTVAFLLNLNVVAVWSRCNSTNQHTMKYIMVSLAGVKFLLLVGYQALHRLRQLVQCARDYNQRQNVDSFDETIDADIPMDSLQGSFGGEYMEIGEDLTQDQNGGDQNGEESDTNN